MERTGAPALAGRAGDRLTAGLNAIIARHALPFVAYNQGSIVHLETSGVMLLDFIGWKEAAKLIEDSMEKTILQKFVTYDFERQTAGATKVGTSEFATRIIGNM